MSTLIRALIASLVLGSFTVHIGEAQNVTGTQFNFTTPGARSLAMGGSFLALADDSTAAYTNPAGLTNLTVGGPEVAVEFRRKNYSPRYVAAGRSTGEPTGVGLDEFPDLITNEAPTSSDGVSFASFGYVFQHGFTAALYAHQLADYSVSYESQGVFYSPTAGNTTRTLPFALQDDADVKSFGVAGSYQIQTPFGAERGGALSIGVGVSYYMFDVSSRRVQFLYQPYQVVSNEDARHYGSIFRQPGGIFGPADELPDNVASLRETHGKGGAVRINVGILGTFGNKKQWSFGGVFRQGAAVSLRGALQTKLSGDGSGVLDEISSYDFSATFHVPDIYGAGVAYSTTEGRTKIAMDYDRVRYSQRLIDVVGREGLGSYKVDDSHEIHAGIERELLNVGQLVGSGRLGAWYETAHELEYTGSNPHLRSIYPGGKGLFHWAGGFGVAIRDQYQFDVALDLSQRSKVFSFSVVRFF